MATKKKEHEPEKYFYKGCSLIANKKFKQKIKSSKTPKTQVTVNTDNFEISTKIAFILNFIAEHFLHILDEKNVHPEDAVKLMHKYKDDLVLLFGNVTSLDYQLFRSTALGFITSEVLKYIPEATINTVSSNLDEQYLEFTNKLNSTIIETETETANIISQNAIQETPLRVECREIKLSKKSAFCNECGIGEYICDDAETLSHKCNNCGDIRELSDKYPVYIEEYITK